MMRLRRFLALEASALLVLALPFLAIAVTGRELPEDAQFALWGALGLYVLLLVFPFVDPLRATAWDAKPLPQLRLGLVVALVGFALLQARALFDGDAGTAHQGSLLGSIAVLAVLGNAFPAMPRNLFVGIRVPWTLRDPEIWARTHRVTGHLLVGAAVLLMAAWPFLSPDAIAPVIVAGFLVPLFAGAAYSWHLARSI